MVALSRAFAIGVAIGLALTTRLFAQTPRDPLVGAVVDPAGDPIAGAMVEIWRRLGEGTSILDLTYAHTEKLIARLPTDKRGGFAVQLPVGVPCELRVDHAPHARWLRPQVLPGEELQVQLAAPATFAGKIVLPSGVGTPAFLRAFQPDGARLPLGRTDDAGNFRFERLPAGTFRVEIAPDKAMGPGWQTLEFRPGEALEQNFEVAPGVVLSGRVTDAATGTPIANAWIGEGWTLFKKVQADRDGHYRLEGCGCLGRTEVRCQAEGYSSAQVQRPDPLTDPAVLDFALERGNEAVGVVVDLEGQPIEGLYVGLFGTVHDGRDQFHDWPSTRTDAEGRFAVRGLRADLPGTLVVRGEGQASLVYHLPAADARGVMAAGTITMPKARVVRGCVLGNDGKPLARVKVGIWGQNGDREALAKMPAERGLGGWSLVRRYVAYRHVMTDDHGAFAFGDLAPGTYDLNVYDDKNSILERLHGVVVNATADPEPVVIPR